MSKSKIDLSTITGFQWDEANLHKNAEKHQVDFRECEEIFFNQPLRILYDDKHSQTEDRFAALGITNEARRLTVVFTVRNDKIRVISARDQSAKEKSYYEND